MNDRTSNNLVHRRVDSWLAGWLAVVLWIAAVIGSAAGVHLGNDVVQAVFWVGLVLSSAHFGLSYHLAYGRGRAAWRQSPALLGVLPVLVAAVLITLVGLTIAAGTGATQHAISAAITTVYLLTTWHYIKQAYGVGRIAASFAGVRLTGGELAVLRYGLYPLWAVGAVQVLVKGSNYNLAGYPMGYGLLPHETLTALRFVAAAGALAVAVVLARRLAADTPLPSMLVGTYAAAFLWLGVAPSPVVTALALAPFHALQYLAVGHRAELALHGIKGERPTVVWWLNIVAGAAAGGLLLGRWVPQWLDQTFPAQNALLFSAAFFVFLNLHHYLVDAAIWRSKGDIVRAIVRPGQAVGEQGVSAQGVTQSPSNVAAAEPARIS